jgi:flagellar hook-basal body complex protein FliE
MSQMEVDRVLTQIRALREQASAPALPNLRPDALHGPSFASVLQQGLAQVSAGQDRAANIAAAFERGTPGVDLPQVMLEMQKANVAFRATVEVRNKLVNAYQEIMNMPV